MKPPTRQQHVEAILRTEILAGTLPPGCRLPSYDAFEKRFAVARATMLYAIRQLKDAGLIESRGRGGLFVAQRPPHLQRFAFVFTDTFADNNLFLASFLRVIPQVEAETGFTVEVFDRVRQQPGNASYQRLLREHAQGRIGGVLFLVRPSEYLDPLTCPILSDPTLPRIAISAPVEPGVTTYYLDACETVRLGTRLLWEQGVRRMALIGLGWWDALPDPRQVALGAVPEMRIDEPWRLYTNGLCIFSLARNLTRLLLDGDPAQRPDGILVLDDHLTSQVGLGVLDAGRAASVQIVSSCNFPPPVGIPVPVRWIGMNPHRLLTSALRDLAAGRVGTAMPSVRTLLPEAFAEPAAPEGIRS